MLYIRQGEYYEANKYDEEPGSDRRAGEHLQGTRRQDAAAHPRAPGKQRGVRLPHPRQPGAPATHRLAPSRAPPEEWVGRSPPRRCLDALPSLEILEPACSRNRQRRGGCARATASHHAGPEAVPAFVRTAVRARRSVGWGVLCATCAGVAVMIELASERDLPEIRSLLERLNLPLAGVDSLVQTILVAREGEHIVGTAALELYDGGALLRSVAVDPRRQGKQLGHRLTEAALRL